MLVELRELSLNDGKEIFDMIQEIGPGESGYMNTDYDMPYESFPVYLIKGLSMSKGIKIPAQYVPQTMFWLYIDNKPVGIGKVRHYLNDHLRRVGGHIAYTIRPSERGHGYGNIILRELLLKAQAMGIEEVLITCDETNTLSRKVIQANGCELIETKDGDLFWRKKLISKMEVA